MTRSQRRRTPATDSRCRHLSASRRRPLRPLQSLQRLSRAAGIVLGVALFSGAFAGASRAGEPLPWETWPDLHRLPVLHPGHQALLRSSHCPDGCRFDRHSAGDWRYITVDGEEGTIFEESGAGAITRIWMTTGDGGLSTPLDPEIRLRIYLDGATTPVIDAPLPALFDGSTPPFLPPLVGDRPMSSGGNYSYVPIPYREGCRVSLLGAHEKKLWYQINFHRLADTAGVTSFTGGEDLSALADLLSNHGQDPWPPGSGATSAGSLLIEPDTEREVAAIESHGSLTALKLGLDPAHWPEVELRLIFDGRPAVQMALEDFFAMGRIGPEPTRSLLVGLDDGGDLYSYFPMPFFASARVTLFHHGTTAAAVDYELRVDADIPATASGLFGAVLSRTAATATGVDFPIVSLSGHGKLAGSFLELGSTGQILPVYLEGDERLFIDHSPHPAVYGTGVEDYFNGGFYFDHGPFSRALHGAPYTTLDVAGLPFTAAYRLMLTEGITFESRLEAGLEGGPTSDVSMAARAVTWFYRRQPARLYLWDRLDLGREADRQSHRYQVDGEHLFQQLAAQFEGEPATSATGIGVYRPPGTASFVLAGDETSTQFRLRRRLDAAAAGQRATVLVGGEVAGHFPVVDVNEDRRWREVDIELGAFDPAPAELLITVIAEPSALAGDPDTFTAFRYELWADGAGMVFADGFESADLRAWNSH